MEEAGTSKFKGIFRKKCPDKMIKDLQTGEHQLKKSLGAFDLTVLGIGAIIGAGIFTLAGTAAAGSPHHVGAGPSLILSFVCSGIVCALAALCYAEFAAMIPVAGSAYTYTYTTLGEIVAWLIGWIMLMEYGIGCVTVACGWSGYFFKLLEGFDHILPNWLTHPPYWMIYEYSSALQMYEQAHLTPDFPTFFGLFPISINLPAILIVLLMTALLYIGIQESAKMAAIMVLLKTTIIILFIIVGAFHINPENWTPFMPNGLPGMFLGAFLVFFAYLGFDSVATAAEECKNPGKDLPIGIITSLAICTVIYILVAAVLTGMVPMDKIDVHAPIAAAMLERGQNWIGGAISLGAVAGLSSVILVEILAVSRILFAMSRDGLLPKGLSKVHPKYKTPHVLTVLTGAFIATGTIFLDINKAAELCNIGTLSAFSVVCIGVIILRYKDPDRKRPFKVPYSPWVPGLGALCSLFLLYVSFFNPITPLTNSLIFFVTWIILGIIIYFLFGINHSTLKEESNSCKTE